MTTPFKIPEVHWAQRQAHLYLTIDLPGVRKDTATIALTPEGALHFHGIGGTDKKEYDLDLALLHEIDMAASKWSVEPRNVQFFLVKKDKQWWERLVKEGRKWNVKVDWTRWVEPGEEEAAKPDVDLSKWQDQGFGQDFGGAGAGAGAGMDADAGDEHDSEDEGDIPGLEGVEPKDAAKPVVEAAPAAEAPAPAPAPEAPAAAAPAPPAPAEAAPVAEAPKAAGPTPDPA